MVVAHQRPGTHTSRSSLPALVRNHQDRKSTRLNSSHLGISYAVFCLKKKNKKAEVVDSVRLPNSGRTTAIKDLQRDAIDDATNAETRRLRIDFADTQRRDTRHDAHTI